MITYQGMPTKEEIERDQKAEEEHTYAIRSLYGTLKDKGYFDDELREMVKALARSKGQFCIGRCTTEQIYELFAEVNSCTVKELKEYLK